MEEALRYLGRPDLARKIIPNRRGYFLDHIINPKDFFENNDNDKHRRYIHKNEKESVFNQNKYSRISGQGKDFRHHKIKLEGNDNSNLHRTQVL